MAAEVERGRCSGKGEDQEMPLGSELRSKGGRHQRGGKRGKQWAKMTLRRTLDPEKSSRRTGLHIFLYFKMGGIPEHILCC